MEKCEYPSRTGHFGDPRPEMTVDASLYFRTMQPGEERRVSELITRVFDEYIAADLSPEGVGEFLKFVKPESLWQWSEADAFVLVAPTEGQIVGMIEVRDDKHISLFFVNQGHLGRGIGRELWRRALARCRQHEPDLAKISVNSSPYAVPIYEKLGFRQEGPEQIVNGVRFVPMAVELEV